MSVLTEKFPGLARYEDPATMPFPQAAAASEKTEVFLDALKKIYDLARQRHCGAFAAGVNFLEWARFNAEADFVEYLDREIVIDDLWAKKAPIEMFTNALRNWARSYLFLAQLCHRAVIDEINRKLPDGPKVIDNGLG